VNGNGVALRGLPVQRGTRASRPKRLRADAKFIPTERLAPGSYLRRAKAGFIPAV